MDNNLPPGFQLDKTTPSLPPGFKMDNGSSVLPPSDGIKVDAPAGVPALPPGFKLDGVAPAAEHPPLPPGFKLDGAVDKSWKGSILPISGDKEGKAHFDIDAGLPGQIIDLLKMPGDVYAGKYGGPGDERLKKAGRYFAGGIAGGDAFGEKLAAQAKDVVMKKNELPNLVSATNTAGDSAQEKGIMGKVKDAAVAVRNIISPTSAGPDAKIAEQAIRSNFGQATRESAATDTILADYEHAADKMTPEQSSAFYGYMENRSKLDTKQSVTALANLPPDIIKFAKPLREELLKRRTALESLDKTESMGFVEDYFPHMWKDPEKAKEFSTEWVSKFGSGRSTNKRSIPTIEDGLKAGLQLAEPNPARAASNYVNSMDRYIATVKLIEDGRKDGNMLWSNANKAPREGWVPLEGPMTRKPGREIIPEGGEGQAVRIGEQRLFAPPDFARVYNNFASKGLEATQGAPIYEAARQIKNTWTATTLALSGYHFGTIIAEQMGTDIGRIMKNLSVGDVKGAGQAAKSLASIPLVVKSDAYRTGKKLAEQYTGRFDHGMEFEDIADHFAKSGGSFKIDPVFQSTKRDDFIASYQKGMLGSDLKSIGNKAMTGPMGSVKATADLAARAADTVSAPLFKRYIPTIKAGAFSSLMGDWIRQHPNADAAEVAAARVHYQDIVEERFGEMNPDNLFWNQTLKQTMGLLLTARTWDLGLARQVAGPFVDLAKFAKGGFKDSTLTDRGFGLAGLLTATLAMNGAYQYLKTGQLPQTAEDWRAPRTGGTIEGQPERVDLPGRLREVKQLLPRPGGYAFDSQGHIQRDANGQPVLSTDYLSGVKSEAYNKLSPPVQGALNYFGGKNPYPNDIPGMPISIGQVMQGKQQGSNISTLETMLGIRGAPFRETNPKLASDIAKKKSIKEERQRQFLEALHKKQYPNDVRN